MGSYASGALALALALAVAVEVLAAAVIDARTRRFPNGLAALLAVTCASHAILASGFAAFASHALLAACSGAALFAVESVWRRLHDGAAGLGGGDIKFLVGFMLLDPVFALASFLSGLALLAVTGALVRRSVLPLLPFVALGSALVAVAVRPPLF